jgi:hypothetical protein
MDANGLLYYLRGIFENVAAPSESIWNSIRVEVLSARPVEPNVIATTIHQHGNAPEHGCPGCKDKKGGFNPHQQD